MKVLFIFHETSEHNGAWKSGYILLNELRKKGVEILVLTPDRHEIFNILIKEGFNVKAIKIVFYNRKNINSIVYFFSRIPFELRRVFLSIVWKIKVNKVVELFKPDIIHSNSSVFFLGYDLAKKHNIPHVWHIREFGDLDFNLDISPTEKRLKEHISYNICITKCIINGRGLSNDKRSCVIYNGIKREDDIQRVFPKSNYFLYVGSLNEEKGIKDILDAWTKFKIETGDSFFHLLIVGGSKEHIKKWENYLFPNFRKNLDIQFKGMRDDVKELMNNAKALIVASHHEAFGRVMAEAMFAGCLVIGRDTAGTKEQFDNGLIEGGEIGIRFNNSDELCDSIKRVALMDDKSYKLFLDRSQRVVKRLYSIESYTNNVYQLYTEICK